MSITGFYSGSFDPVTHGHTDVIFRACGVVSRLVIGVGVHPAKKPLFSDDERVSLLADEAGVISDKTGVEIEVVTFADLAVDAARRAGASVIIRGLRDGTDFDYEMQMAGMNDAMAPEVQNHLRRSLPLGSPYRSQPRAPDCAYGGGRDPLRLACGGGAPQSEGQAPGCDGGVKVCFPTGVVLSGVEALGSCCSLGHASP